MNTARADAQKYGLGAIVVAVVVLLLFFFLNGAKKGDRPYIGAPAGSATTSDAAAPGASGAMSK